MRKLTLLVCLFFTVVNLSYHTSAQTVKQYLKWGDQAYKKFNSLVALGFYKKAYDLDTNNYVTLLKISKTYNALCEEAVEDSSKSEAKEFAKQGVNFSNKMRDLFPDSSNAYAYLAISYGNLANISGSKEKIRLSKTIEENAKKAIEKNPNSFLPYLILGIYYKDIADLNWFERTFANLFYGKVPKGSIKESIEMLNKAYEINPNVIATNYQLALDYKEEGNKEKEIFYLKRVIELPQFDFKDKFYKDKAKARLDELDS